MLLTKNLVTQLRAIVKHSIKIDAHNKEEDFRTLWAQMKEILTWYINGNTYHVRTHYTKDGHDLHIHLLNAGWQPEVVIKTVYKRVKDSDVRQRKDLRWINNDETEAEKTIIMLFHFEAATSAAEFIKHYFVGLLSNVSQTVPGSKIEIPTNQEDNLDEKELITMAIMKDIEKYNSWFLFKNHIWKKI